MLKFLRMRELDLAQKRVLVREDLNVPVREGKVTSDARIRACLPTIRAALEARARVMLLSHLGRPTEGVVDPALSLAPVAERLSELLAQPVRLAAEWLDGVSVDPGEVVLCENVRFNVGEKADDEQLSRRMAALCDIYVMDAFGTAHRAQASTHGVARFAPTACAGPLLGAELDALGKALSAPARPLVAVVGGAKVSTKLEVLEALIEQVDALVVGGGIANTFIAACGHDVGESLYEPDLVDVAKRLLARAKARGIALPIPTDVRVATHFAADATARTVDVGAIADSEMVLDVGPNTAIEIAKLIGNAATVVWNGPLGVFEFEAFADGTRTLAESIAASNAFSIAGGGDTLAAIEQFDVAASISYISTGGGAFLEFLEGKTLPAVAMLERRSVELSR